MATTPKADWWQPTLFESAGADFAPITSPEVDPDATIQERFRQFHELNPQVFSMLVRMALNLKRSGVHKIGIAVLVETIRYHYALHTYGDDFKINSNYSSRYSRLIMQTVPELDGFFTTRELKTP